MPIPRGVEVQQAQYLALQVLPIKLTSNIWKLINCNGPFPQLPTKDNNGLHMISRGASFSCLDHLNVDNCNGRNNRLIETINSEQSQPKHEVSEYPERASSLNHL
jgi:hypothetical protein